MNAPVRPSYSDSIALPLLGRAGQMDGARVIQMFGSVAVSGAPETYNPEIDLPAEWPVAHYDQQSSGHSSRCERLWRISSTGISVQRFSGDGVLPIDPGSFNPRAAANAGGSLSQNGFFKIGIKIGRATGNSTYLMDVGESLDVYCYSVAIGVVGPTNSIEITPGNLLSPTSSRSGVVVDARLGVDAIPTEGGVGNRTFKFTQHFSVVANTQVSIPIPRSAIDFKIYQTAAGASSGDWVRFIGDPAVIVTAFPVGVVSFANRASLDAHAPIGDETHLVTDLDVAVNRLFTVIWTIRP